MKRFTTALAMCGFLLVAGAANANTWTNTSCDSLWSTGANWIGGTPADCDPVTITSDVCPGTPTYVSIFDVGMGAVTRFGALTIGNNTTPMTLQVNTSGLSFKSCSIVGSWIHAGTNGITITTNGCTGDTGIMSLDSTNATFTVNPSLTTTTDFLVIDADTANASRTLTKAGSGALTVTTATTITGDDDAGAYPATCVLSAGTLDPAALTLDGGNGSDRQARFVVNGGTLTQPDSTTIRDHVELNVADGQTANFGPIGLSEDATLEVDTNSTGVCQATSLTIDADNADDDRTLTKTGAGTLTVNGQATLTSGDHDDARALVVDEATLEVSGGTVDINDELELNASNTVAAADATVHVSSGATFEVDDIDCNGGVYSSAYGDRGLAVVDFDSTSSVTDDVFATGDVDFGGDTSFAVTDELKIGDYSTKSVMYKIGSGTVTAGSIRMCGDASGLTSLYVEDGAIQTN